MVMNYPTIGEYNQVIKVHGGRAFRELNGIDILPSRTLPIKVFLFGSGAFAAVFKGVHQGRTYAIRCFLSAEQETIIRTRAICEYLKGVNASWLIDVEFLENEISVNRNFFPVVKMGWVDGMLINEFVSTYLDNNNVLSELQKRLVAVSESLESYGIGHGDIQCGNIIITGNAQDFTVKLIDYDGMFVPNLAGKRSLEKGRSEFQLPSRSLNDYNPEMDRFSFWVIITAIEAIKNDKTLWRQVMQGGYNTLDNFLFTSKDFQSPNQSALLNRLRGYRNTALNHYVETLRWLCNNPEEKVPKPKLFEPSASSSTVRSQGEEAPTVLTTHSVSRNFTRFTILTPGAIANVLTSTFQKIGTTPLELDRSIYMGKTIVVSNGIDTKLIKLGANEGVIEVFFN
jgi:hypothetical protein